VGGRPKSVIEAAVDGATVAPDRGRHLPFGDVAAVWAMLDPCSKLGFVDWRAKTAAARWLALPRAVLDHRRFWDAMDGPLLLDYETGGHTTTAGSTPTHEDDGGTSSTRSTRSATSTRQASEVTANNYNPSRSFNAIDQLHIAVP